MKLCVFQGTFNPIHNAHLRVANYVSCKFNFDKILFIPAFCPPHKNSDINFANHRLEMVKLAIKNYPKFEVCDIEYKRKGKSYTYLTIKELYEIYKPDEKINFIIGTDAFDKIESWYHSKELKNLLKFIIFKREENFDILRYNDFINKGYDFDIQTLPYEDISSTELRIAIKENKDISNYVPLEVKEYIEKNELYRT